MREHFFCWTGLRLSLLMTSFSMGMYVHAQESINISARVSDDGRGSTYALSLTEAVVKTLKANPELAAFEHELSAQRGIRLQAGLAPNPELNVSIQDVLGTGEFELFESAETTVSIAWILERGVRERRVQAAAAGASLVKAEFDILRLDTAAETARLFLACLSHQALVDSTKDAFNLAADTVQAVEQRVNAGIAPDAELARAEAELARVRLQLDDREHELLSAYYRLAAQWGQRQPGFDRVAGELLALPGTMSFEALQKKLEHNPDINRLLTLQRLKQAELNLATAKRKPNWEVSVGVRRFEAFNDQALIAGLTIPLAINNRNQGNIQAAGAELSRSVADTETERLRVHTRLFVLHQDLLYSLKRVDTLAQKVLPRLEKALTDTRRAYESGRYNYFEWRVAQSDLLATREEHIQASTNVHANIIEIERLTGLRIGQIDTSEESQP